MGSALPRCLSAEASLTGGRGGGGEEKEEEERERGRMSAFKFCFVGRSSCGGVGFVGTFGYSTMDAIKNPAQLNHKC